MRCRTCRSSCPIYQSQSWKPYLDIRPLVGRSSTRGFANFIPRTNVWKTVAFNRNRLIPSRGYRKDGRTADGLISIRQSKKSVVMFDRKLISFCSVKPDLDNSNGNEIGNGRSNWNFWIKGNEVAVDRFSSPLPLARFSLPIIRSSSLFFSSSFFFGVFIEIERCVNFLLTILSWFHEYSDNYPW